MESPAGGGGTNVFVSAVRKFGSTDGGSAFLEYNGTTWTTHQENTTVSDRSWAGPALGGWPYNNTRMQIHNGGLGSGNIARSTDGGQTWVSATGNLATIDTGVVSYIIPIWIL